MTDTCQCKCDCPNPVNKSKPEHKPWGCYKCWVQWKYREDGKHGPKK